MPSPLFIFFIFFNYYRCCIYFPLLQPMHLQYQFWAVSKTRFFLSNQLWYSSLVNFAKLLLLNTLLSWNINETYVVKKQDSVELNDGQLKPDDGRRALRAKWSKLKNQIFKWIRPWKSVARVIRVTKPVILKQFLKFKFERIKRKTISRFRYFNFYTKTVTDENILSDDVRFLFYFNFNKVD